MKRFLSLLLSAAISVTAIGSISVVSAEENPDDICYCCVEPLSEGIAIECEENAEIIIPLTLAAPYTPSIYSTTYGYDALNDNEKLAYEALYARACEIDTNTEDTTKMIEKEDGIFYYFGADYAYFTPNITFDELMRVLNAFKYDNPQFFWIGNCYLYSSYTVDDIKYVKRFTFSTKSDICSVGTTRQERKTEFFDEIQSAVYGAGFYKNDYSKLWYAHDYLCNKAEYDYDAAYGYETGNENAHNASGFFIEGKCVCEGYAKAAQLLLNALEIDTKYIVGTGNSGGHAWNQVKLGDNWYNLDVTWDDLSSGYYYRYFNKTDEAFERHTAWENHTEIYSAEVCNSTEYSYENHDANFVVDYTVTVGDINFDSKTNIKDVTYLKRYVNGWYSAIDTAAADVNGDGNVDIKDATILTRYINGWDVTLG